MVSLQENPSGRRLYVLIVIIGAIITLFYIYPEASEPSTQTSVPSSWHSSMMRNLCTISMFLCMIAMFFSAFSVNFYRRRIFISALYLLTTLTIFLRLAFFTTGIQKTLTIWLACMYMLFMVVFLLFSATSRIAQLAHPFYALPEVMDRKKADVAAPKGASNIGKSARLQGQYKDLAEKEGHEPHPGTPSSTSSMGSYDGEPHMPLFKPIPAMAIFTYKPTSKGDLGFEANEKLWIINTEGLWWLARNDTGEGPDCGFVPSNFVRVLTRASMNEGFQSMSKEEVSVCRDELVELLEPTDTVDRYILVRKANGSIGKIPRSICKMLPIEGQPN